MSAVIKEKNNSVFQQQFAEDIDAGLSASPKKLSSKYFYDERGDELFQLIMKMPEYYLTDCEYEVLDIHKQAMLELFTEDAERFRLIEFGAGDGFKTKVLLRHFQQQGANFTYMPIDISQNVLDILTGSLQDEMPNLSLKPIAAEYFQALEQLQPEAGVKNVVLFLGSNIGNFTGELANQFLGKLAGHLKKGDLIMVGMDLKKDPEIIMKAYNDTQGITKAFNLNLLTRINKELQADFDLDGFIHWPMYDPITGETRSFLVSKKDQTIYIEATGSFYHFKQWEPMHLELSQKYDLPMIEQLSATAGFSIKRHFYDCKHWFVDSVWSIDN